MDDEERITAIHEAGHAVALVRLFSDRYALDVSIEPEPGKGRLGTHAAEDLTVLCSTPDEQAAASFEAEAIYSCAGYAAVLAAGYPEAEAIAGCESDFAEAGDLLDIGKSKAVELMQRPENQQAVKHVADELSRHRCLDGDHVAVLIYVADGDMTEKEYQAYLKLIGR